MAEGEGHTEDNGGTGALRTTLRSEAIGGTEGWVPLRALKVECLRAMAAPRSLRAALRGEASGDTEG